MQVIAKTTGNGFLIQATQEEIREIVNAVTGKKPDAIEIGQKIPAIDYASTIIKIKSLKDDSYYQNLVQYHERVSKIIIDFKRAVEDAVNTGTE